MLLNIDNIFGGYSDTRIIQGVSASISQSEIVGLFGRNGVGKTTLCRLISGELPLRSGSITFMDVNISEVPPFRRQKLGIGYMPQTSMVFDQLTVKENLELVHNALPVAPYFERFPKLSERLTQRAGTMSGGERKILAFVRTMIEPTKLIILDEPSEGVQPENIEHMRACIAEKRERGASILLVEQNLKLLKSLTDRFWGMESGDIILNERAENMSSEQIRQLLTV